ncbi:MAG TPA: hypothetical protein VIK04_16050 [Solirubrobacteraceae bacterium]
MAAGGLRPAGRVRWGEGLPASSGVYVVSLGKESQSRKASLGRAPISVSALNRWLEVRPELLLDGRQPTSSDLAEALSELWLPDEVVLYIGKATSLQGRVRGYYSTDLGQRRPHAGGRYLKTLAALDGLYVHYAPCEEPEDREAEMIGSFVAQVSKAALGQLRDPEHPFPFADSEWRPRDPVTGRRHRFLKQHGIRRDIDAQ